MSELAKMCVRTVTLCLALSGCTLLDPPPERPEVALAGVALEKLSLTEQVFRARLVVDNPNRQRIKIDNAVANFMLAGTEVGSGATVAGVNVPGLGREFVDVRIATNLLSAAPQIWASLNSGDGVLDYRVDGFVDLGFAGIARLKFDESGRLDASRLLSGRDTL